MSRQPATRPKRPGSVPKGFVITLGVLVAGSVALLVLTASGGGDDGHTTAANGSGSKTGATGPMGGEIVETPGTVSGTASAGGVEVANANYEMGPVPMNVTVVPKWTLRNTSDTAVSLDAPHAEVVEGCCPGTPKLSAQTLAPGAAADLEFPLQMHDGMGGPHHFILHVPVRTVDGSVDFLELNVTGDFA